MALKEITTFRNKVINKDKDIVHDPEYSYVNELRQCLFGRWFYLLDTNFDTFLLSELNVDKGFDSNNYLSRHVMKRGDEGSVKELYDFWTRNSLSCFNLTQVGANFSLLDLSSSTSIGVIRKSLYADLVNYCSLDSVAKNSVGLMSELDWKDPQIDSLLNVRNANPCERK